MPRRKKDTNLLRKIKTFKERTKQKKNGRENSKQLTKILKYYTVKILNTGRLETSPPDKLGSAVFT